MVYHTQLYYTIYGIYVVYIHIIYTVCILEYRDSSYLNKILMKRERESSYTVLLEYGNACILVKVEKKKNDVK